MAIDIGKAQTSLNLIIVLAIVGIVAYAIYKLFNGGPLDSSKPENQDPNTGQYIGPINALDNYLFPTNNPGGGEEVGTSQTYTGALQETLEHPIDTLDAIFLNK